MSQVTSAVVANNLLGLAKADNRGLTPLKLVKLVYLCEGWSLALRDKSIIREEVEAWQYGPVIPELYAKIRQFKATPVTHLDCGEDVLSGDQKELVSSWSKTWDKKNRKQVIPTSVIQDHFKELAAAG